MLKNTYAIALLSFAAFGFTAMPASADKITTQIINQNAAIVGDGNYIEQNSTQLSIQNQPKKTHNSRSNNSRPTTNQVSTQKNEQNAAIVGNDNYLEQNSTQVNVQNQPNSHSNSRKHNSRGNHNSRNNSVSVQDNLQQSQQNAGVVGNWNDLTQNSNQINVQQRKQK